LDGVQSRLKQMDRTGIWGGVGAKSLYFGESNTFIAGYVFSLTGAKNSQIGATSLTGCLTCFNKLFFSAKKI
jgi:hypothetical protein